MSEPRGTAHDVTRLLHDLSGGDESALERLVPLIYDELRAIAAREMRVERSEHTLQPTALVHELFLRLRGGSELSWTSRAHFLNIAAQAMRRILVDHARARRAEKRGGDQIRVTLDEELQAADGTVADAVDVDRVLQQLVEHDPRKARVVELRIFGGLSVEETASTMGISEPTVKREWRFALAWMRNAMSESGDAA
jgi:RNA polymerase sigma factor (TIGR02999 family)